MRFRSPLAARSKRAILASVIMDGLLPPEIPAPTECPACSEARTRHNRNGEAGFSCGSTTMSIREGFTICAKPREDRPRERALYRQHLRRESKCDPLV